MRGEPGQATLEGKQRRSARYAPLTPIKERTRSEPAQRWRDARVRSSSSVMQIAQSSSDRSERGRAEADKDLEALVASFK